MIVVLARFVRYILVATRAASGRDGRVGGQIIFNAKGQNAVESITSDGCDEAREKP